MGDMQVFDNRAEAGTQLGEALADHDAIRGARRVVVLAVPRGGLPVGVGVARRLGAELDVVVARKLRAPSNPEIGFGAVGSDGRVEVDEGIVERLGIPREAIEVEVADRREAVRRRLELYRSVVPELDLDGATVVVVDDGVATGGTVREACAVARRGGASIVVLAVPVAPADARARLADAADHLVILSTPAEFLGVSQAFAEFEQLDDEASIASLRSVARTS
jgi:predicted phosphoribosyltransferase